MYYSYSIITEVIFIFSTSGSQQEIPNAAGNWRGPMKQGELPVFASNSTGSPQSVIPTAMLQTKSSVLPATTNKQAQRSKFSVAVKSLSKKTNESTLFHFFKKCGKIENDGVTILKHGDGTSKRMGFVNFSQLDGLMNALSKNGCSLDGSTISVERAVAKKDYEPLTDCQFYMKDQCTKEVSLNFWNVKK